MLISGLNGMTNQRMFQSKILSQFKRKHSWNGMTINVVFPSLCPFKLVTLFLLAEPNKIYQKVMMLSGYMLQLVDSVTT